MSFVERFPSFAGKTFTPNSSANAHSQCTSIRIVQCDYTMSHPEPNWDVVFSEFNRQQTFQIPVIRIFGPQAKTGRKVCAHVHGVLPYFYVSLNPNVTTSEEFVRAFAQSCELALRSSSRAQNRRGMKGNFVHNVEVVAATPIYGYYDKEQEFLKIYMYNPAHVNWLADILGHGAIMNTVFQPYESHIPFVMQFFQDYNLYGMNLIHFSDVKHRLEEITEEKLNSSETEKSHVAGDKEALEKVSVCEVEFDSLSCCILNKSQSEIGPTGSQKRLGNPGLRLIWQDEFKRQSHISQGARVDIANPSSPERTNIPAESSQKHHLNEICEALGSFEISQTFISKTAFTPGNVSFQNFKTPCKNDFEIGKAKASSTPFHGKEENSIDKSPGKKAVSFSSDTVSNEPFINEEMITSMNLQNVSEANSNCSYSSLKNFLAEMTQASISGSLLNQSGIDTSRLHEMDDEEVEDFLSIIQSEKDLTWSEKAFFDLKLDTAEDRNLSQIVECPEDVYDLEADDNIGPDDENEIAVLAQLDGRSGLYSASSSHAAIQNDKRQSDNMEVMRPCIVRLERLAPSLLGKSGSKLPEALSTTIRGEKKEEAVERRTTASTENRKDDSMGSSLCDGNSGCANSDDECSHGTEVFGSRMEESLYVEIEHTTAKGINSTTPAIKLASVGKYKVDLPCFEVNSVKKLKPCLKLEDSFNQTTVDAEAEKVSKLSNRRDSRLYNSEISICEISPPPEMENGVATVCKSDGEGQELNSTAERSKSKKTTATSYSKDIDRLTAQNYLTNEMVECEEAERSIDFEELSNISTATTKSIEGPNLYSEIGESIWPDDNRGGLQTHNSEYLCSQSSSATKNNSAEILDTGGHDLGNIFANELNFRMLAEDLGQKGPKLKLMFADETQVSPKLFSSPENDNDEVSRITFANLPPTRGYVMSRLEEQSLCEFDYSYENRLLGSEIEPFHHESVDALDENFDVPVGRVMVLTPAMPPPVIDRQKLEEFVMDKNRESVSEVSEELENSKPDHRRPSSPSMFYSFMPPQTDLEVDKTADLRITSPLLLESHPVTPFCRRHSTTGVSIHEANVGSELPKIDAIASESSQDHRYQNLTMMSMELHVITRSSLLPDPLFDPIVSIFYAVIDDCENNRNKIESGVLVVRPSIDDEQSKCNFRRRIEHLCVQRDIEVKFCNSEFDLIIEFSLFIRNLDPDILVGYEVQNSSWGYLLKRGTILEIDKMAQICSRIPMSGESHFDKERDAFGADEMSEVNLVGRLVLNMWRILKSESNLRSSDFHVVYHEVMKKRIPVFKYKDLTSWFNPLSHSLSAKLAYKTFDHLHTRCIGNLEMLLKLDLVTRTSEMSRLFGILFFEVLTRGTQFRVESMLIRSAKARNFVCASPSIQQRARMRAPEHIPLVLEPESRFYADPVLVLDFQSLYPSMMIAYNYCYSTCLGRIEHLKDETNSIFQLGTLPYFVPASRVRKLIKKEKVHIAPNGVVYVDTSVRKGLICQMVEDILNTRVMVKRFMKNYKKDPVLYKMLDARQLGLKLIANTTYGYTGASFSGRMPCVEIADSIVRKARETLEKSIDFVNNYSKWKAEVVYGDTDSMFVRLPGASRETAFKVGHEISDSITQMHPKPVKLKFEKVYQPCVLITKKRYVGYSYETLEQREPVFDAKGIETVRRDNCPVVGKVLEKSLRLLFDCKDLSVVKDYVQRQLNKISHGRVPLNDFVFAKEFRGRDRYKPEAHIAALKIADKRLAVDPMAEPLRGDRVPYCIVYGAPKLPLYKLIRSPNELAKNPLLRLNALYYIMKQVLPPLDRIFGLIENTNVFKWFNELPVYSNQLNTAANLTSSKGSNKALTLSLFVSTKTCMSCFERQCHLQSPVCNECLADPQYLMWKMTIDLRDAQKQLEASKRLCLSCSGHRRYCDDCDNFDCPIFQKLLQLNRILPVQSEVVKNIESKLSF